MVVVLVSVWLFSMTSIARKSKRASWNGGEGRGRRGGREGCRGDRDFKSDYHDNTYMETYIHVL